MYRYQNGILVIGRSPLNNNDNTIEDRLSLMCGIGEEISLLLSRMFLVNSDFWKATREVFLRMQLMTETR